MLLKLALKNVIRYKRRTFLTFIILSFGVGFYIWMTGLLAGFDLVSTENLINFETGHFQIRTKEYTDELLFAEENFIKDPTEYIQRAQKLPFVTDVASRITIKGEIDNSIDSQMCVTMGIDQKTDFDVFTVDQFISEGSLKKGGALLGNGLAEDMKVGIGDYVYFTFRTPFGMIDSIELEVTGILNAPDPAVNSSYIFMDLEELKSAIEMEGVTEIALKTEDYEKYAKYYPELKEEFPELDVLTWRELGEAFFAVSAMKKKGMGMIIFFIAIIAIVGIVNTMLMSVLEKKKEIGTLKALGMTDGEVQKIFVWEGFIIGIFGAVFGLALGALFQWYFLVKGFNVAAFMGDSDMDIGYKVMGWVKSVWDVPGVITSMSACVIASVIASFIPAKKTTELEPAECLRTNQ